MAAQKSSPIPALYTRPARCSMCAVSQCRKSAETPYFRGKNAKNADSTIARFVLPCPGSATIMRTQFTGPPG